MDPTPLQIRFPKTGQACEADFGDSLVDAVFRHDLPVRFKCERAVCTTCLVEVLKGMENLAPPGARELQTLESAGLSGRFRLACQVELRGDVELDYVPLLDPRRKPRPTGDDLLV
ncbi:MAG TPA: 2Fe-2S iron-sulfur cluster-binding protein [bacterium]|nr:2Fe-2S iron-sulfur cluster-binding protein [bacterium]